MAKEKENKHCGCTGKLLRVDLTHRTTRVEDWDRSWIGGKAFGQWALFNEEPVDCHEFDPRRMLIISSGPLNGTTAPASVRLTISSRNLLTGGCSSSSVGGYFAPEMKYAGYDHMLITGKADTPVYLYIQNEQVKILDASHLWGRDTWETESALKRYYSNPGLRVACIGPAGENRVRFACIIVDKARAAAWGGNGALMGAKNLKAIAVRGTNRIPVANPSGFLAGAKQADKKICQSSFFVKALREIGTMGVRGGKYSTLTFRNYQDESWDPPKMGLVSTEAWEKYEKRRVGCFSCTIKCGHLFHIEEGKYAGLEAQGVYINTIRAFGSNLDISSPDVILKASAMCNQYGLNIDAAGAVIGWVFGCFERGIITEKDLGFRVGWGDDDAVVKLIEDITYRRRLGDILAEGIQRASKTIGKGSEKLAVLIKGAEINEGQLRSHRAWALGIMVSPRGGGHLDGAPLIEGGNYGELWNSVYGIPNYLDATSYEHKAKLVIWMEKFNMLANILGVCVNVAATVDPSGLVPEDLARLYSEATGDNKSAEALFDIAERAINIQKAFNTLHGNFTRKDDYPPSRLLKEPIKSGPFKGCVIEKDKWDKMLDDYYELHGWDKSTGLQTTSKLQGLGLGGIASRLAEEGLI